MWQKAAEFTEESGTPGKALALPLLGKDSHRGPGLRSTLPPLNGDLFCLLQARGPGC